MNHIIRRIFQVFYSGFVTRKAKHRQGIVKNSNINLVAVTSININGESIMGTRVNKTSRTAQLRWELATLLAGGLMLMSLLGAQPVFAQDNCMEDVVEQVNGSMAVPLNCTANDVSVGIFTKVSGPTTCVAGDTITVELQAQLTAGANERWDIGLFVALEQSREYVGRLELFQRSPQQFPGVRAVDSVGER